MPRAPCVDQFASVVQRDPDRDLAATVAPQAVCLQRSDEDSAVVGGTRGCAVSEACTEIVMPEDTGRVLNVTGRDTDSLKAWRP